MIFPEPETPCLFHPRDAPDRTYGPYLFRRVGNGTLYYSSVNYHEGREMFTNPEDWILEPVL